MREAMTKPSLADFAVTTLDGQSLNLADLTGRVLLIVNTASECGFTPQYAGLQALHERYGAQGLTVLGFPCNYGVGFPMMAKVDVNGAHAAPLFRWLKEQAPGLLGSQAIKWNFTKFLIGRDGRVIRRYAPQDKPESLARDIEVALAA